MCDIQEKIKQQEKLLYTALVICSIFVKEVVFEI